MKRWLKSVLFFCLYYSGVEWLLSRLIHANAVAVLMYHGVCDSAPIPDSINFHVGRRTFARQMQALARRYPVVPLSELVSMLSHGEPLQKSVVLTFDDGYRNNATYADPILESLNLPYTIFIATAFIGSNRWIPLNDVYHAWSLNTLSAEEMQEVRQKLRGRSAEQAESILTEHGIANESASQAAEDSFAMLDWDQVRHLVARGVEFGSHTHDHANLAVESKERLREELQVSKQLMEKHLETPVKSFAYPFGAVSDEAELAVQAAGYDCGVSTTYGLVTDSSPLYRLPRIGHDSLIWMFTGEILYQFIKSRFGRRCSPTAARASGQ
jgi:peptidoglycan/xylan/chitin deacetylase (PgdA/CDA1 family)